VNDDEWKYLEMEKSVHCNQRQNSPQKNRAIFRGTESILYVRRLLLLDECQSGCVLLCVVLLVLPEINGFEIIIGLQAKIFGADVSAVLRQGPAVLGTVLLGETILPEMG